MKKSDAIKVTIGVLSVVFFWYLVTKGPWAKESEKFIDLPLKGVVIEVRDIGRGRCFLAVKNAEQDTVVYQLSIADFLKENNIEAGDSVYKAPQAHSVFFFKRIGNGYYDKPAELYYY